MLYIFYHLDKTYHIAIFVQHVSLNDDGRYPNPPLCQILSLYKELDIRISALSSLSVDRLCKKPKFSELNNQQVRLKLVSLQNVHTLNNTVRTRVYLVFPT